MEKTPELEIESRREQIQENLLRLQEIKQEFITSVVPFLETWIQDITRQYIERNPEKSLQLGLEGLTAVKTRVKALCKTIKTLCDEIFSPDEFWPENRNLLAQNQLGLRTILGKLGVILEECGLVRSKAQTEEAKESWNQYDKSGNRREFDGTLIYPHAVELPNDTKNLLEEYRSLIQRQTALTEEIRQFEFAQLQKQAIQIWDSIPL
jgi:hypothetical protein